MLQMVPAPSAPHTRPTQRLLRPPHIQNLGAEEEGEEEEEGEKEEEEKELKSCLFVC